MDDKFKKFNKDKETVASIFKKIKDDDKNYWEEVSEEDAWADSVNSPYHYTRGKVEAIDIIEDAIKEAPTTMSGFLQGQVLKYMLRLWHKIDAKEDAQKAKWYLEKLISSL